MSRVSQFAFSQQQIYDFCEPLSLGIVLLESICPRGVHERLDEGPHQECKVRIGTEDPAENS